MSILNKSKKTDLTGKKQNQARFSKNNGPLVQFKEGYAAIRNAVNLNL